MAWKTITGPFIGGVKASPSMGPRFNGVEDLAVVSEASVSTTVPSMGPRFNGVEDQPGRSWFGCNQDDLQWGHALMAWKTLFPIGPARAPGRLQWGHALMAWKTGNADCHFRYIVCPSMGPRFNGVEDRRGFSRSGERRWPSMGPRFNGVEDVANSGAGTVTITGLQWGHALMAWKTRQQHLGDHFPSLPSMGPRFNGVEDLSRFFHCHCTTTTFNGATL